MIARSHIWRHAERTTLRRSWLELGAALAAVETNMTEDGRMVRAPPAAGVDPESMRDRRVCSNDQGHAQAAADPGLSSMFQVRHKIAWSRTHVPWTASGGHLYGFPLTTVSSGSHYDYVWFPCWWDLGATPISAGIRLHWLGHGI